MDLPLESPLNAAGREVHEPGRMAGRPLEEWNGAYARVESYFHALRVRNKVLLGQVVIQVLDRAMRRAPNEPTRAAAELAAEEMDHVVTEWFAAVLQEPPTGTDHMLSTRGRLALLLADMPGQWQDQFLRPAPWPEEFVAAMRMTYLQAGPDFQLSRMTPRPMHFGPITALSNFRRFPYLRMALLWAALAGFLIIFFMLTHR
jgi:hypothetical protein